MISTSNSFQRWAINLLARYGVKAEPRANWIAVDGETIYTEEGVGNYVFRRVGAVVDNGVIEVGSGDRAWYTGDGVTLLSADGERKSYPSVTAMIRANPDRESEILAAVRANAFATPATPPTDP